MKRMMLLASLVALVALMLVAAPAMANERHDNRDNHNHADNRHNDFCDFFDCNNVNRHNDFCDFFDCNNFNNSFDAPEISQTNDQDVRSGASSQSIIVEGGGDNSNQCVAIQPISNTGNATSGTGVLQATPSNNGSFDHHQFNHGFNGGGDIGVRDAGNLTINPSQSVTCDQQVNQAATAFN
jgi:hypothetical protein